MNSCEKGKRGERQWRDELRVNGFRARRGQQFSGSPDSPDVVCEDLPWAHFEVKAVEKLNIYDAVEQAQRDSEPESGKQKSESRKIPFVAHRRNHRRWLVTMTAEVFFRLLRGDFYHEAGEARGRDLTAENAQNAERPQAARRETANGGNGETATGGTRGNEGNVNREIREIRERAGTNAGDTSPRPSPQSGEGEDTASLVTSAPPGGNASGGEGEDPGGLVTSAPTRVVNTISAGDVVSSASNTETQQKTEIES